MERKSKMESINQKDINYPNRIYRFDENSCQNHLNGSSKTWGPSGYNYKVVEGKGLEMLEFYCQKFV